ncbi:MAG: hypothetical protein LW628_00425 [Fimbriimonadaceae bacterium]|nr:hypothetical protein [Fimbriimonadaceae bacterium]
MDSLTREILILMVFCIVWTLIATPTLAREMHRLQWVNKSTGDEDYVARSRFARCSVYAMCSSIPLGSHIQYPNNWLAVLVVAPTIFYLGWILLKRLGA